ncbi:PIG-L family deacetylase [Streptomyces yangpuensis]|uniref:PIG-L family deacetylase n=1 Tax=Streptomyces yangpuensis TaxID=1648182 RepID=UPI00371EEF87
MSDGHPYPGPAGGGMGGAPDPTHGLGGVPYGLGGSGVQNGLGGVPSGLGGSGVQYGQDGQYDVPYGQDGLGGLSGQGGWRPDSAPQQYHPTHLPHQHQHPEPVGEFHHVPQPGWDGLPAGAGYSVPHQPQQGPQVYEPQQPQQFQQFHAFPQPQPQQFQPYPHPQAQQPHVPQQAAHTHGAQQPYLPPQAAHAQGPQQSYDFQQPQQFPAFPHPQPQTQQQPHPQPQQFQEHQAQIPEPRTPADADHTTAYGSSRAAERAAEAAPEPAERAQPTQRGRKAARSAREAAPEPAEHTPPTRRGRRAAGASGEAAAEPAPAAPQTRRGRKAARSAREAEPEPAEHAQRTRRGRRAAQPTGEARPGSGAATSEARPGRHRWAGLVKAVALCAATAAAGMLVLRGNAALDGLDRSPAAPDASAAATATAPVAAGSVPDPGRVVQIIAHPDDDLYFMNPDLRYSISAGHPVTSVYLTAGEADGVNAAPAKGATTAPNKPAYAEARQNGIRAAYAKMATGDRTSAWKRTVVPTKGGGHAEVDVLVAKPQVNLVWLQLREAGHGYADVPESLHGLWNGKVARLESMLSSGTPVKQRFAYSKDQVVQTLVGVLEQYRPTTVRFQDPTPGRYPDTKQYTDHQDHFYGARFVQMATAAYAKDVKDRPHFAVQNYVGYFNGSLPSALDPQEAKEKLDSLDTYAWLDRQNHCGSDAGCGDLKVSGQPGGNRWADTVNYARGTGTNWLTSDKDHGLWAFKVLDGQVAVWHRPGPVGPWRGPDLLPGTGMDPGVTAVTLKDGRIALFGTRTSFGARPTDYQREVVHAVQQAPGADGFGEWQSLGTPETADETWTSDISAPAVSVDGTGQLAAYVRDGSYSLRGRLQGPDGSWGPWEKHGGEDLHGAPVTATDGAGRRMVLAATSKTVVGWAQPKAGAPLGRVTATGLPDTTLPLTVEGREGGVRLWFRKPGSGNVRTALMTADDGLKVNNMTDLGGLNGFGSVTASGHVLAGRAAGGQLGAEVGPGRPWGRSPLMFVGAPSSTMTGKNMVSLAVVGLDARLYVTSSADAPNAYLAPWQPVGPRNARP